METAVAKIIAKATSEVVSLPMRDGNLTSEDTFNPRVSVVSLPMRDGNFIGGGIPKLSLVLLAYL